MKEPNKWFYILSPKDFQCHKISLLATSAIVSLLQYNYLGKLCWYICLIEFKWVYKEPLRQLNLNIFKSEALCFCYVRYFSECETWSCFHWGSPDHLSVTVLPKDSFNKSIWGPISFHQCLFLPWRNCIVFIVTF